MHSGGPIETPLSDAKRISPCDLNALFSISAIPESVEKFSFDFQWFIAKGAQPETWYEVVL